jgi:hypothetical protein
VWRGVGTIKFGGLSGAAIGAAEPANELHETLQHACRGE